MRLLQKSIIKLLRNIMDTRRSLRKFYRFAYWSVGLVFVLVLILFLIITDASIYENREKHPSPYNKEVSNLFIDCSLVDPKNILASYQQIREILKTEKQVKQFIGCQINFDKNGIPYSYQFYFDIQPKGRFLGILMVNVGTGHIEKFDGISAYEEYTHFWLYLTEPSMFTHKKITENVLEKRISDINKKIDDSPYKVRAVYIEYDKTEFRFEDMESSLWDKIEYP